MAIDLDELIRNADPARSLVIPDPDPAAARAGFARRTVPRRTRIPGLVGIAFGVSVSVAVVALVFIALGGHRKEPVTSAPGTAPKIGVVLVHTADPQGGLPWGLELVKASYGRVCIQVDRVDAGRLGAIGAYGAYHNDGRFHPVLRYDHGGFGEPWCTTPNASGNVFYSVLATKVPASAAGRLQHGKAQSEFRTMEFGLYGPDLVSITYVTATGRLVTQPAGPGGSFLVVLPATNQICRIGGTPPCLAMTSQSGIAIQQGVIAKLTYRNGSTCQVPVSGCLPSRRDLPPLGPLPQAVTQARVAAPVTARPVAAAFYCKKQPVPTESWIPCSHGTPPGDFSMPGVPGSQELVQISFIAPLAADGTRSYYEYSIPSPCGGGQGGGPTKAIIRAGQRVIVQLFVSPRCRGRYTGLLTYQPNGRRAQALGLAHGLTLPGSTSPRDGSTPVGRFSFTIP